MHTKKFNESLKSIFTYADTFCDFYKTEYKDNPDLIYCILAFEKFTDTLSMDFTLKRITNIKELHDKVFRFDYIVSSWRENLTHYIPTETKKNNDIYAVLFAVLQSIETIFAEYIEDEECINSANEEELEPYYDIEPQEVEKHFPD